MEETVEKVVEITYEVFQSLLKRVGLSISRNLTCERNKDGWTYKCSVEAENLNRRPNYIKSAMHGAVIATGDTPEAAINAVFAIMRDGILLLGTHNDYTSVIEWDEERGQFIERKLTKEEVFQNFSF